MLNFHFSSEERRNMLGRLVTALLIAAILTIILSASGAVHIFDQAIYSFAIATLMWFFMDVGDFILFTNVGKRFPFSKKRYLFAAVAIILANYCGFLIGDWLTIWDILTTNPTQVWTWAFLELVLACFSIWFFKQQHHHQEERKSSSEMRLRLLESQLEPHMLYNTLANLRALVKTNPDLATQMLDSIVDYLRATLGGSRATMHPMSEEFSRLNDYLEIMKIRMGARLGYTLNLPTELTTHPIPPFLLQPLVENAIKHGLEPKIEGGRIAISARIEGEKVIIDVSDTGVGSDAEQLSRANGFGIIQVTERLSAAYGSKGTINFIASEAYKTSAKITFPFIIQSLKTK